MTSSMIAATTRFVSLRVSPGEPLAATTFYARDGHGARCQAGLKTSLIRWSRLPRIIEEGSTGILAEMTFPQKMKVAFKSTLYIVDMTLAVLAASKECLPALQG